MIHIRTYSESDFEDVLQLLHVNIPSAFALEEVEDFVHYLRSVREDYFVAEKNGVLTGCGGINYFQEEALARLSWDMVHPDWQGKGIGKALVRFRLDYIRKRNIYQVQVRTSQIAQAFYTSMGFKVIEIKKDFWAEGFNLVDMRLGLR